MDMIVAGYDLEFKMGWPCPYLVSSKRTVTDPDYTGFVGEFDELIVTGWNRSVNDRPYVLLNVRENPEWAAKRQASES